MIFSFPPVLQRLPQLVELMVEMMRVEQYDQRFRGARPLEIQSISQVTDRGEREIWQVIEKHAKQLMAGNCQIEGVHLLVGIGEARKAV